MKLIIFLLGVIVGNAVPLYIDSIVKKEPMEYCADGYIREGKCHIIHYGSKSNKTKYRSIHQ